MLNSLARSSVSKVTDPIGRALLRAGLSEAGMTRAEGIMELEAVLRALEGGRGPARDPERYFVTIFGDPAGPAPWGWRFEGHHL